MPIARANGIQMYYEIEGSGDPVVLIAGLGADAHFWYKQVPALSPMFRVMTLDNRDSGRSEKVVAAYTIRAMADDLMSLLETVGIDSTCIVGASLGGFIAQEFALAYPDRVRRLVLCCTSHGGPNAAPVHSETLAVLMSRTGDPERDLRAFLRIQFGTDYLATHAAEVDDYLAWRVAHAQPLVAYQRQLMASAGHNTEDRLGRLAMPVLILHGSRDRVVPVENAHLIARKIPQARVEIFKDGGHLFLWEFAGDANRMIAEFLQMSEQTAEGDEGRARQRRGTREAS